MPSVSGRYSYINMAEKKRLLFVNQEVDPYLSSSPGATLARELITSMHGRGCEARTFMPRYGSINERRNKLHEVIRLSGANIAIGDSDHPLILKVASLQPSRIQVYFIDNEDFFEKEESDSDPVGSNRDNNVDRMIFYARGTVETIKKLQWEPHLIGASGWMSSLFLPYMRKLAAEMPSMSSTKLVYTVTDDRLEAAPSSDFLAKLQADGIDTQGLGDFPLDTDLAHRIAIRNADAVVFNTAAPNPQLEEYASSLGLPVLHTDPNDRPATIAAIKTFFSDLQA